MGEKKQKKREILRSKQKKTIKLPCRESNPGWPGESRPCYRLHHKGKLRGEPSPIRHQEKQKTSIKEKEKEWKTTYFWGPNNKR